MLDAGTTDSKLVGEWARSVRRYDSGRHITWNVAQHVGDGVFWATAEVAPSSWYP